jgi:hypothetical protein
MQSSSWGSKSYPMKVSPKTKAKLAERRESRDMAAVHSDVAIQARLNKMADDEFGREVFTLFYRKYVFAGSSRPTGIKYCLRTKTGCYAHGIVFGPLKNAIAELPGPAATWKIPTQWSPNPIRALGTCHENRSSEPEQRGV